MREDLNYRDASTVKMVDSRVELFLGAKQPLQIMNKADL